MRQRLLPRVVLTGVDRKWDLVRSLIARGGELTERELRNHTDGAWGGTGVPGQPSKARSPTQTGPGGSVISLKDMHPEKAPSPISVRLSGSVISAKDVHW